MGTVFEAFRVSDGARVALKVLRGAGSLKERTRRRFAREVQALERVLHPSVVPLLDADPEGAPPWLAMPFVDGPSLADVVDALSRDPEAPLTDELARRVPEFGGDPRRVRVGTVAWGHFVTRVGREIAEGLSAAHEAGVVHRDLKPANVMLDGDGAALLLDFGLARDAGQARFTLSEERLGTPLYMCPEQLRGESADARTDVHGLGLVLFELAGFRPAFQGFDLPRLDRAIRLEEVPSLDRFVPGLPVGLARTVSACLAKDRRDRFASAAALARALVEVEAGRVPRTPSPPWHRRLALAARRRPVRAAGVLLLVLATTSLAAFGERWADPRPPAARDRHASGLEAFERRDLESALADLEAAVAAAPWVKSWREDLRRAVRRTEAAAVAARDRFEFERARALYEALAAVHPSPQRTAALVALEGAGFGRLESLAESLLGEDVPRARVAQALAELRDPERAMALPPNERDRLLAAVLESSAQEAVQAAVLSVAADVAAHTCVQRATEILRGAVAAERRDPRVPPAIRLLAAVRHPMAVETCVALARNGTHVASAIRALGEIGSLEATRELAALLTVATPAERVAHLVAALLRGRPEDLPASERARLAALLRPRLAAPQEVDWLTVVALLAALEADPEGLVRVFRARQIGAAERVRLVPTLLVSGPAGRAALLEALAGDPSPAVREACAAALGHAPSVGRRPLLEAVRREPSDDVRARLLVALGRQRAMAADGEVVEAAIRTLVESEVPILRVASLVCLGLSGGSQGELAMQLARLLEPQNDAEVRTAAAWALAQGEVNDATVRVLLNNLDREIGVANAAVRAGAGLEKAGRLLKGLFADGVGGEPAAEPFEVVRDPGTMVEVLLLALERQARGAAPAVTERIVRGLEKAAQEALAPRVRAAAVASLGRLGAPARRALPALEAAWETEDDRLARRELALALTRLGRARAGEAWLAQPPRDGEDALARALILTRLDRGGEARGYLRAAARLGVLDASRMKIEPELEGLSWLGRLLGRSQAEDGG